MLLLEDPTLAGPPLSEGLGEGPKPVSRRNWEGVVQKCLAAKPSRADSSSKLLTMRHAVANASARLVFQSQVSYTACAT